MKNITMIAGAALLAAACAQTPNEPVQGHASPEFLQRLDSGEFKAYEVEEVNRGECAAVPPDRAHETPAKTCSP